ncbi:protein-glutamine gamma-glutamyltransferase E-like [Pseudophryne corroboree]|uniref:protein-glutamine gamma-glutamyltransferase E-like n=1 Tax=Pseudophryne corroboree TaxID=495146 RepID=UPI0030815948
MRGDIHQFLRIGRSDQHGNRLHHPGSEPARGVEHQQGGAPSESSQAPPENCNTARAAPSAATTAARQAATLAATSAAALVIKPSGPAQELNGTTSATFSVVSATAMQLPHGTASEGNPGAAADDNSGTDDSSSRKDGLQLNNVNLQQSKNASTHRTSDYDTSDLVVRRGQTFEIALTFNRAVQSGDKLSITVETGPSPSESKNTRAVMPVSSSGNGTSWNAVRGSGSNSSMTVTINAPVNACIGQYKMSLQVTSGGRTTSASLGKFYLLFNPWASGDDVYMSSNSERGEYVLNETGLYWFGNVNEYGSRRWDYGQFESDILNIVITMLDSSVDYQKDAATDVSRRNDPVYVGRVLSAMVNSIDDNGIIVGNWSGDYSGGVSPTQWNGSAPILRKWKQSGPVKYGQCWVYAGVLCTVLRCLGIPARVIINFESAHDTDGNLVVNNYYDENGKKNNNLTNDSVWNFHAWDEAWFARKDLGSLYNGWQILDATPQEQSQGMYRLGPSSLKAVKEGDVDLDFDTPFVFAEVNADVEHWVVYSNGSKKMIYSEPKAVGRLTSTKAVGSFTRMDVTNDYKYPEGSSKEREIFNKAKAKIQPPRMYSRMAAVSLREGETVIKPTFSGTFKKIGEPQVGEDFTIPLILKNTVADTKTVKVNITATVIIYNTTPVKDILTEAQSVTLGPNEEKSIPIKMTYDQYEKALTPDNMIQFVAVCEDTNGGRLLADTVVTLKNPPLLLRVRDEPKLNKLATVDLIFSNPIQENVAESLVTVEGSGLMKTQMNVKVPCLKPNQRVTVQFEFFPYRCGERSLLADFSSDKFQNVKAFQSVKVASS